jgi:hypothetical protein
MLIGFSCIDMITFIDLAHFGCDAHRKKKGENVVRTIFGQKDIIKVRHDIQSKGIQQHLWLRQHPNNQHKILKPHAPYVLTTNELDIFLLRIGSMKLPTNYGASLAKHAANKKLNSMKPHGYHMLM